MKTPPFTEWLDDDHFIVRAEVYDFAKGTTEQIERVINFDQMVKNNAFLKRLNRK